MEKRKPQENVQPEIRPERCTVSHDELRGATPADKPHGAEGRRESWSTAVGLLSVALTILLIIDLWLARDTDLLEGLLYPLFSHEYRVALVVFAFPVLALLGLAVSIWLARRVHLGRSSGRRLVLVLSLALLLLLAPASVFGWEAIQDKAREEKRQLPRTATELLEQYGAGSRQFREVHLVGVSLHGADLREAVFLDADLSGADLTGADLYGAELIRADLSGADLSGTDLSYANLAHAGLADVKLHDASLFAANLRGAKLSRADLSGTTLRVANLSQADLRNANLTGADLRWAILTGATVTDEQLDKAASLEGATMPDGSVHE